MHHLVSALSSTTGSSYQHPKGNVKRLRRRSSRKRRTGCIECKNFQCDGCNGVVKLYFSRCWNGIYFAVVIGRCLESSLFVSCRRLWLIKEYTVQCIHESCGRTQCAFKRSRLGSLRWFACLKGEDMVADWCPRQQHVCRFF